MSYDYEPREPERSSRRYTREETRVEREPRYADDSYLRPYPPSGQLVPRRRNDSDLSVEEVRRDFSPPGGYRDSRRARSAEPGYNNDYRHDRSSRDHYDRDYDRGYDRDYERDYERDYDRRSKRSSHYEDDERSSRRRVLKDQEKIIAAVAGAALAFGGKELYDRYDARENGGPVDRNYMHSAALGAAGALAGYQGAEFYNKRAVKEEKQLVAHRGRDGQVVEEDKGSRSFLENALAASGLGAAVKAFTGSSSNDDKSKDGTRSRAGSPGRGRSQSRARGDGGNDRAQTMQKAAMASLIAGASEAFRVAREPGSWRGEKAKRIVTAAAGAATIDAARGREEGSKLGLAQSVMGGLLGNRVINGSRNNIEEDKQTGRSRSRSRAGTRSGNDDGGGGGGGATGLAALATAGLGALGAKKVYDHARDGRDESRGRSVDSYDNRDDRPQRSRSRSVVDSARKRLAKIGIGSGPEERDRPDSRRDDSLHDSSRGARRAPGPYPDDPYYDDYDRNYQPQRTRELRAPTDNMDPYYDDTRSHTSSRRGDGSRRRAASQSSAGTESDLGDSDDDLKESRRKRGKQILTTGLATVATIHAANGVYTSYTAREARHKAVKEGRLSPEEARKLRTKAMFQDAAQIGLAGLGIKGALSQMKSAKDQQHECKDWEHQRAVRHQKRLERQRRVLNGGRSRSRADDWHTPASPREERYDYGPQYLDGNPYATGSLPAPPVGYDDRYDRR